MEAGQDKQKNYRKISYFTVTTFFLHLAMCLCYASLFIKLS